MPANVHAGRLMTSGAESQIPTSAARLRFDRYVLDRDRGCLLLDGKEVALRPKTFAVLRHLAQNNGRLVSKDELFAAVWPNLTVTDDALVQSIGELRRALGDHGAHLIKTVPRRGYRFESDVTVDLPATGSPDAPPSSASTPQDAASRSSPRSRFAPWPVMALALCFALVALLWIRSAIEWSFFGHGSQTATKSASVGAKPAIAILPFENQSEDKSR